MKVRRRVILKFIRRRAWQRDPHCAYCGRRLEWNEATLDHVEPRSKGGSDRCANLVLSCEPCNVRKSNRLLTPDLLRELAGVEG